MAKLIVHLVFCVGVQNDALFLFLRNAEIHALTFLFRSILQTQHAGSVRLRRRCSMYGHFHSLPGITTQTVLFRIYDAQYFNTLTNPYYPAYMIFFNNFFTSAAFSILPIDATCSLITCCWWVFSCTSIFNIKIVKH